MIPAGGNVTFDKISEETGLAKYEVRRLVRHAVTMRIFEEVEPEVITHSNSGPFSANDGVAAPCADSFSCSLVTDLLI